MVLVCLLTVIAGVFIVNSFFSGSFLVGLLIIVLPLLLLAYLLPRLLPVKCSRCGARMRFKQVLVPTASDESREFYGYACPVCSSEHLWEGASPGGSLD